MKFNDRLVENVVVFELSGKIMGGDEKTLFYGRIHEYVNLNKKNVVLDLKDVEWMNSIGIGMLTASFTTIAAAGGRLALANITNIESILALTRLISIFPIYDSQQEAVESFKSEEV